VAGKNPKPANAKPEPEKFYAVAKGGFTGIFSDWDVASMAITGVKGPKYKKFATKEEAMEFMRQWGDDDTVAALEEEAPSAGASTKRKAKGATEAALPPGMIEIYTDGSSRSNGKTGAKAGVGVFFGNNDPR
jgi:ribonuclease HI